MNTAAEGMSDTAVDDRREPSESPVAITGGHVVPSEKLDIVYCGNSLFGENRTSSHHIARLLSRDHRVLYVDVPGIRVPRASGRDMRRIGTMVRGAFRPPTAVSDQLWHMSIPQAPYRNYSAVRAANKLAGTALVRRSMRRLGFKPPVLWTTIPHTPLVGTLDERLCVYYCTDAFSNYPRANQTRIKQLDEELTTRSDLVFVTSELLLEEKKHLNTNIHYSPHGVDVELFSRAADPNFPANPEAAKLSHPVVGFFGLIEAWMDIELLLFLAKSRPEWTFLFIGRVAVDCDELARQPNVIFKGPQPYEELAGWAKAFDVAVMPYRDTAWVQHANPLKLREYLATGKPVVGVPMPSVQAYSHLVGVANDKNEFLHHIERALTEDTADLKKRRMEAVKDMTWEARVSCILKELQSTLAKSRSQQ